MAPSLDQHKLDSLFHSRPDILEGIRIAADTQSRIELFNNIADHVYSQLQTGSEPANKKRKIESALDSRNGSAVIKPTDEETCLEVAEISISVPLRKKMTICMTKSYLYVRTPADKEPAPGTIYAWDDIEYAFYLPVPEKTQVQHNYVLFPRGTCHPSKTNPPTSEPLVFTISATAPKQGTISGSEASSAAAVSDDYKSLFHWAITRRLKAVGSQVSIVEADAGKFHSVVRQPHRPKDKAYHVKGFRGSKDGYLFFLANGIFWGFKKPLIFIPLERVAAVSYTNILQITFNMVVEVFTEDGNGDETEEMEFGMLDQQDYAGIDGYLKLNKLQDRSMAEQRKAKLQLAENKLKKGTNGEKDQGEGDQPATATEDLTELERAQQEAELALQDEEDEDEEDYDPGSEGESEGSGASSDEEDDDDDDDNDDDDGNDNNEEGPEEEEEEEEEAGEGDEEVEDAVEEDEQADDKHGKTTTRTIPTSKKPKPAPPAPPPVRSGWATITSSRPRNDDMDVDETFDVVG